MATEKEIELKENNDFGGLLKECLQGIESVGNLPEKIFKVAYYSGRIHDQNTFNDYLKKHALGLNMGWISEDQLNFSIDLFRIGFIFPLLSENDFIIINTHYCDYNYFDILEDILFDQHLLNRQLIKYDQSVRFKRNKQFSDKLLEQIIYGALINEEDGSNERYFYNRSKNSVISKDKFDRNIEKKVEFLIQFDFRYKEFADAIDLIFGIEVRKAYLNQEFVKKEFHGLSYDHKMFSFNVYDFEPFEEFLKNNRDTFNYDAQLVRLLKNHFASKWLTKINE